MAKEFVVADGKELVAIHKKERTKEVWWWNKQVKGDDHPDTKRALREMQVAHGIEPTEDK